MPVIPQGHILFSAGPQQSRQDADFLVVPDIVSGNIAAKTITVIGGGRTGGVVLGAKVPVLLVSRAASADDKYMSIVIAALVGSR